MAGPFRIGARDVPYIAQMEATECGAACLAMVLAAHGCHVPLATTRAACGVSRDGASAFSILEAARAFGLHGRGFRLEPGALHELALPAILHWELNHFVVLERVTREGVRIVDPAMGVRHVERSELDRAFTGVALTFERTPAFKKQKPRSARLLRYLGHLPQALHGAGLLLLAATALEVLGLLYPAAYQVLLDLVIKPKQERWLSVLAVTLFSAFVLRFVLSLARDQVMLRLRTLLDMHLTDQLVTHLLRLPIGFFQQRSAGDLMKRVASTSAVRDVVVALATAVLDGGLILSYSLLMLAYDVRVGALVVGLCAVRSLLGILAHRTSRLLAASGLMASAREASTSVEAFSAPETTKAFGTESVLSERYLGRMTERVGVAGRRRLFMQALSHWLMVVDGAARALLYWVGGNAVIEGRMTLGVFGSFVAIEALLGRPNQALMSTIHQFALLGEHLQRIDDVLDTPVEPRGSVDPGIVRGAITLENVSYRYSPSSPNVLRNVSLDIQPGEKVAVVGLSGSGKSTLAKILMGVLEPTQGRVLIDGRDMRELDREKLRRQMGVVLQDAFLFEGSIRHNIALGHAELGTAQVREAAQRAMIEQTILRLPHGYESVVHGSGTNLSGGERQRLAVARALAHRPPILIMDEATGSLDLPTEARLHDNLADLQATRVVVAHRLATVRDADRIVVLYEGAVGQEGDYHTLAHQPGLFRAMVRTLEATPA